MGQIFWFLNRKVADRAVIPALYLNGCFRWISGISRRRNYLDVEVRIPLGSVLGPIARHPAGSFPGGFRTPAPASGQHVEPPASESHHGSGCWLEENASLLGEHSTAAPLPSGLIPLELGGIRCPRIRSGRCRGWRPDRLGWRRRACGQARSCKARKATPAVVATREYCCPRARGNPQRVCTVKTIARENRHE